MQLVNLDDIVPPCLERPKVRHEKTDQHAMLTGWSIRRKNFIEPERAGVVTRPGRVAGFIVETTNVPSHPTLLQAFRHTDSSHTSAQARVAHWADIQYSNMFSMKLGELAIPLPKCNIVRKGNMVRNLPES